MMRKLQQLVWFVVVCAAGCFPQASADVQGQSATSPAILVDCSDPFQASSPECSAAQTQGTIGAQTQSSSSFDRVPQLRAPSGSPETQTPPRPANPSELQHANSSPWPQTEFQQMAADSAGRPLPLFGQSLFDLAPSTFAPMDQLQVPTDYIIGPGDGLQITISGQLEANLHVIVDRSGQIYIPRVGQVSVAGVHYSELEQHLKSEISKVFRKFNVSVNVERLR